MVVLSSKEAKEKFGIMMDTAIKEPVTITKHNRPTVVVVSSERYAELEACEDRVWTAKALEAEASGILSAEETVTFLKEQLSASD